MKLTQRIIEGLTCPAGKKDILKTDAGQDGLNVRVGSGAATGSLDRKSYLCRYTIAGQKRKISIGACNAVPLAKAREAARIILGDVARGIDPAAVRKQAKQEAAASEYTLEKMLGDWEALHLADMRPRYAAEATRALRKVFGAHLELPADRLTRAAVIRGLDATAGRGSPQMGRMTQRYGHAAFAWASKRGSVPANPFANLPGRPIVRRERVLADEELSAIWCATEGPGPFNGIVRILILSGQRRNEVAGMAWAEIADDLAAWQIPGNRSKNGNTHIVPLNGPAQDLLRNAPKLGELIFPGLRGPFCGWAGAKADLDRRSGVTDWRLHDLRRTCATGLQRLGIRLEVTEQILNHVSGSRAGIVGVYQRHDFAAEKRAALEAWGQHVMAIVEGREAAGNVVKLARNG